MTTSQKRTPQFVFPRGFMGRITFVLMNRMHGSVYSNGARALALQPDDDLLEVACGNGYFLKKYASGVRSVAGLDLSPLAVKTAIAKNKSRVTAGTATFVQGDASRLPWPDESFSAVAAIGSFIVFPEPLEALREMRRVLRPRGRAVITIEWNAEDDEDHAYEVARYGMCMWTAAGIRQAMEEAGFSGVFVQYARGSGMPRIMIVRGLRI